MAGMDCWDVSKFPRLRSGFRLRAQTPTERLNFRLPLSSTPAREKPRVLGPRVAMRSLGGAQDDRGERDWYGTDKIRGLTQTSGAEARLFSGMAAGINACSTPWIAEIARHRDIGKSEHREIVALGNRGNRFCRGMRPQCLIILDYGLTGGLFPKKFARKWKIFIDSEYPFRLLYAMF